PAKSPMETNTAPSNTSEDTPERLAAVTRRTVITDSRKSNSARPGPPWGNMENNRCTDCKSNGLRQMGNPNLSDVFVTLLRDTKFRRQEAGGRSRRQEAGAGAGGRSRLERKRPACRRRKQRPCFQKASGTLALQSA